MINKPDDSTSASPTFKSAFSPPGEILETIRSGISDGIPDSESILSEIFDAISLNTWTPLPPESCVFVLKDGKWVEGVEVVALNAAPGRTDIETRVITHRGHVIGLDDETVLELGPAKLSARRGP
jgi:hypothetical protein